MEPEPNSSETSTETETAPETPTRFGRRLFFSVVGMGAAGIAFGAWLTRGEHRIVSDLSGNSGVSNLLPGGDQFRIYSAAGTIPSINASTYSLRISGLVKSEKVLTLDDLKALPPTHLDRTFQCVTGWQVPKVSWKGVKLSDLLDLVEPTPNAHGVGFTSYDGLYTESLTIDQARRSDVLVAYEMFGEAITPDHGGPVRLYVAPMYGYKSAKWLKEIRLVEKRSPGYWEQNGYTTDAWIGRSNGW
jgi:DMSO/TMAO reductase YedYZ molybdopterin-dependent catalytic subunit